MKIEAAARLQADKWSQKVKTKKHTPPGLFEKSAGEIAKWMHANHDDLQSAMASLNFYYNRKGDTSDEEQSKWDDAKAKLRSLYGGES